MPEMPGQWADRAACKGHTDLFFPTRELKRVYLIEARRICSKCPVRKQCADHALHNVEQGIWAGHGSRHWRDERKRLGIELPTSI